jgi:hypothetical protein
MQGISSDDLSESHSQTLETKLKTGVGKRGAAGAHVSEGGP